MKLYAPSLLLACLFFSMSRAQVSITRYRVVSPKVNDLYLPEAFRFSGFLGGKMDAVIDNNLAKEDVAVLVDVFRHRNETNLWQTEFWGKWMLGASKAYQYSQDAHLLNMMRTSTKDLIATQTRDGYIGNYADGKHLGPWDIWGRKYTLLGLLYYYDLTGDTAVLQASRRLLDFTMTEVGPGHKNIVLTGAFRGMPSSSILEPVVMLYQRTNEKRYLDFARYIVAQWETPQGPQLISKALQEVPVAERFHADLSNNWWSWDNSRKAYEMMSCYDGLLQLYKVTGDKTYLQAVQKAVASIRKEEINIVGSGAAFECWYGGVQKQAYPAMHTMETCVTITWMKLCYELYRLTGDPQLAENIETSAYNNLLGSLLPDGSRFSKYSGLQGYRGVDDFQCNMQINCCMANGPRGLMLLQDIAVMQQKQDVFINLYSKGSAGLSLAEGSAALQFENDYPDDSVIRIQWQSKIPKIRSSLHLRIPSWSDGTVILINGQPVTAQAVAGNYCTITREWQPGDTITLRFDMRGRILTLKDGNAVFQAVARGPVILARDSRFGQYDIDDELTNNDGKIPTHLTLTPLHLPGVWLAYSCTMATGAGEGPETLHVPLVDFSSAGNEWKAADRYRVWVPVIMNVMKDK